MRRPDIAVPLVLRLPTGIGMRVLASHPAMTVTRARNKAATGRQGRPRDDGRSGAVAVGADDEATVSSPAAITVGGRRSVAAPASFKEARSAVALGNRCSRPRASAVARLALRAGLTSGFSS